MNSGLLPCNTSTDEGVSDIMYDKDDYKAGAHVTPISLRSGMNLMPAGSSAYAKLHVQGCKQCRQHLKEDILAVIDAFKL